MTLCPALCARIIYSDGFLHNNKCLKTDTETSWSLPAITKEILVDLRDILIEIDAYKFSDLCPYRYIYIHIPEFLSFLYSLSLSRINNEKCSSRAVENFQFLLFL